MDLKQLEYFVRVAELGSFTKAAATLRVAQPALSRQIRQLEASLRTRLLTRNGRGVVPTDSGKRFLDHSRGILRQVSRAREDIEETRGGQVGRVVVGMPTTVAATLAVSLVKAFRQSFPKVKLSILQGRSATLQEWLASGGIDIAVLYDPPYSPLVRNRPLLAEDLVLVQKTRPGLRKSPLPLSSLPDFELIIPSRRNTMRSLIDRELARLGLTLNIAIEIDYVPNIIELVSDGFGAAVLSPRAIRGAPARASLSVRPIVDPVLSVHLALCMSTRRPSSALLDATASLIMELSPSVLGEPPAMDSAAGIKAPRTSLD